MCFLIFLNYRILEQEGNLEIAQSKTSHLKYEDENLEK